MSRDLTSEVRESLVDPACKRKLNSRLFSSLAPSYDSFTPLMSLWRDRAWKRRMVGMLPDCASPVCVDVACGTGDVIEFLSDRYSGAQITGIDLVRSMLLIAQSRQIPAVALVQQDMCSLGFRNDSVDILTAGYAIRNAPDLGGCLDEIHRVLKPGGSAAFLEISKPQTWPFDVISCRFMGIWGKFIGLLFHWSPEVSAYVGESLKAFPGRARLRVIMREHGLQVVRSRLLLFGLAEILVARKI